MADNDIVTIASAHSVADTVKRLEKLLHDNKVELFARVDHGDGAKKAGMTLRPTMLLIFGNPQVGTPLMQSKQIAGIDLPLKMLVWEDETGTVRLSYNRAHYVAERHGITDREDTVKAMDGALEAMARVAASS